MDELGGELLRVAPVPAVADDDHDRSVPQHAASPVPVEVSQRVADASPSAEIVYPLAHRFERAVQVAIAEQSGDSRQARREHERLKILATVDRVREDHQEARVALHRTAHVADENERPPPHSRLPVEEAHQLPTRPNRMTRRTAKVDATAARRTQAARLSF